MSEDHKPPGFQYGLADLLLTTAAFGLWLSFWMLLRNSGYVSPALIPLVLFGITVAVHRLLRGRKHAWPLAAVLAPLIAGLGLAAAFVLEHRQ